MNLPEGSVLAVEATPLVGNEPLRCCICGRTEDLGLVRGGVFRGGVVCCFRDSLDLAAVIAGEVLMELEAATGGEYAVRVS